MSVYRLECRKESGEIIKLGTAWHMAPDLIVTAFHVVGDNDRWYSECEPFRGTTYHLLGAGEASNEPLQPLGHDSKADIAILQSSRPLPSTPLVLSVFEATEHSRWAGDGFPSVTGGAVFRLNGQIAAVRSNGAADDLQLTIDQGDSVSWEGASGSAVCVEGRVVGILTEENHELNTVRAARTAPLRAILQRIGRSEAIAAEDPLLALPDWFVPRDWAVEQFDRFMTANTKGYFPVVADAGMGKSILARDVARRYRAIAYFFSEAEGRTRSDRAADAIVEQLASRYGISRGKESGDDALRIALEKVPRDRERIVLVLDATDESDHPGGNTNPALLPKELPDNVFVFLTARPQVARLQTLPGTPVCEPPFTIHRTDPHQQAAIMAHVRRRITEDSRIQSRFRVDSRSEMAERLISEILDRSEGNFMYVAFVLDDLARATEDELDRLAQRERLPKGLLGYYSRFWEQCQSARQENSVAWQEWTTLYRPTLQFLVACREMVSASWLGALVDRDPGEIETRALDGWRRFLRVARDSSNREVWGVVHQSFADYLIEYHEDELKLRDAHSRIADYYMSRWGGLEGGLAKLPQPCASSDSDEYGLRHLATHLERAGRSADLHQLLELEIDAESNLPFLRFGPFGLLRRLFNRRHRTTTRQQLVWFAVRDQGGDTAGFLADVARAWRLAEEAGAEAASLEQRAAALVLQCRYALLVTSIRSLAGNLPPELLLALVREGEWTPHKALTYARQIPDHRQRLLILAKLGPFENDAGANSLHEALATAESIRDEKERAEALAELAPYLPEYHLRKAMTVAAAMRRMARIAANGLAPRLAHLGYPGEALAMIRTASKSPSKSWELMRLFPLLRDGVERDQLVLDASASLRFGTESHLTYLLSDIPYLPETLFGEALELARSIADQYERATTLIHLYVRAPVLERPRLLHESLEATRPLDATLRINCLSNFAEKLGGNEREQLLGVTLSAIGSAERLEDKLEGLARIVSLLTGQVRAQTLCDALDWMRLLSGGGLTETTVDFVRTLAAEERAPFLKEALSGARRCRGEVGCRARGLADLVSLLSGQERDQVATEGIEAAFSDGLDPSDRIELLLDFVPYLPNPTRDFRVREAVVAARLIEDSSRRAALLAKAGLLLPAGDRAAVFNEAIVSVAAIPDETERGWTLKKLASVFNSEVNSEIKNEILYTTVTMARSITNADARAEALNELASHLPQATRDAVWPDILAALREMSGWSRRWKLRDLAPRLPEQFFNEAFAAAKSIDDDDGRVEALVALTLHAPKQRRESALRETLAEARASDYEEKTLRTVVLLLPSLPSAQREPLISDMRRLASDDMGEDRPALRALMIGSCILFLPPEERPAATAKVLAIALGSESRFKSEQRFNVPGLHSLAIFDADTIALLACNLPKGQWARLLTNEVDVLHRMSLTDDPHASYRTELLSKLSPYLDGPLVRKALSLFKVDELEYGAEVGDLLERLAEVGSPAEALDRARALHGPWYDRHRFRMSRAVALAKLSSKLPLGERREVLREALQAIPVVEDSNLELAAQARIHNTKGDVKRSLKMIESMYDSQVKASLLEDLAPKWPDYLLPRALGSYFTLDSYKILILKALLHRLRGAALTKVVRAVRAWDGTARVEGYAILLPRLSGWKRWIVRREGLRRFRRLERGYSRDYAAPYLALALAMTGSMRDALDVALDCGKREESLNNIAPYLPADLLDAAISEAPTGRDLLSGRSALPPLIARWAELGRPEKALLAAGKINNVDVRLSAFAAIAPHLPKSLVRTAWDAVKQHVVFRDYHHSNHVVEEMAVRVAALGYPKTALGVARRIEWTYRPDVFLEKLLPHLSAELRERAVSQALVSARMRSANSGAFALAGLARHFHGEQQSMLYREAIAAVQSLDRMFQEAAIKNLISLVPELLLAEIIPLIMAIECRESIWGYVSSRSQLLSSWAARVASLPAGSLYPIWCESLRHLTARHRRDLLADLGAIAPVVRELGGAAALNGVIRSIAQVCRWFR